MTVDERRTRISECCAKLDLHYDRKKEGRLHTDLRVFPDSDVEWHFTPSFLSSPSANKRLLKWFEEQWGINVNDRSATKETLGSSKNDDVDHSDSSNSSKLSNLHIKAPSAEFDLVFLLLHIYRHMLFEGIGMRQVLDYYCVLMRATAEERCEAIMALRSLGVDDFAEALMWVFAHVFANENESWMLCQSNEARGRMLLEMIMEGGNFGRSGEYAITAGKHSAWWHISRYVGRKTMLLRYYPSEIIWNLLNKMKI